MKLEPRPSELTFGHETGFKTIFEQRASSIARFSHRSASRESFFSAIGVHICENLEIHIKPRAVLTKFGGAAKSAQIRFFLARSQLAGRAALGI